MILARTLYLAARALAFAVLFAAGIGLFAWLASGAGALWGFTVGAISAALLWPLAVIAVMDWRALFRR